MSVESKTVVSLKGQLSKFSGIISKRFNKAKRRLIKEMLYGIQASEGCEVKQHREDTQRGAAIDQDGRPIIEKLG